jgi:response regulator RpfG family c-di-GMP phosphodiesterase
MSVVDIFDALTTVRPYKAALTLDRAFEELTDEVARGWRNPEIVDVVLSLGRNGQLLPPIEPDEPTGGPGTP